MQNKKHLVVPYTLDVNDMRFVTASGLPTVNSFSPTLRMRLTVCMKRENQPSHDVGGTPWPSGGRPGRIQGLDRFMTYLKGHQDVWVCRRIDIANHWHAHHS